MTAAPRASTSRPVLTIAIPTYNRVGYVEPLVRFLADEIRAGGLQQRIEVLVADNASPDGTEAALAPYVEAGLIRLFSQPTNRGAGYNTRFCLVSARSDLVWVLGDDDRPTAGALGPIVDLLTARTPDLVFLPPVWVADARKAHDADGRDLRLPQVSPEYFARVAGVGLTFLSSFIVNVARLQERSPIDLEAAADPWLPQLDWVVSALDLGESLYASDGPAVIATSANSGSYPVIQVFASSFEQLVRERLTARPGLIRPILADLQERFLPPLVWRLKSGLAGRFGGVEADDLALLRGAYRGRPLLGAAVTAVLRAPRVVGWGLYAAVAVWSKLGRTIALKRLRPIK